MSASRAHRRRAERQAAKTPVIVAGDGIVAGSLGAHYEAKPHAQLPAKVPGVHRWIATASWVITPAVAATVHDPDALKFLDNENLHYLGVGCWDCEQVLGAIDVDSPCPGEPS